MIRNLWYGERYYW